jgi:hypothetical protein
VILQVAPWRLLWWVMTAITLAPLPLVAAGLPPDEPRGASEPRCARSAPGSRDWPSLATPSSG